MDYDIDYERFVFHGEFQRVQPQTSVEPLLVDHWVVWVLPKQSPVVNNIIKNEFKDTAASLRHLKRFVKTQSEEKDWLRVLLCSCELISKTDLENILFGPLEKNTIERVKIPLNKPFDKDLNTQWSSKYWPIVWKGNPMIQELNETYKRFDKTKITNYLRTISNMAKTAESLPIVTIFVDPETDRIMASQYDKRGPADKMKHSIMNCIDQIASDELKRRKQEPDPSKPTNYLCLNYHVYTTHEPCTMCAMALLHSRISRLVYLNESKKTGAIGIESGNGHMIHLSCSLNWKYESFRYIGTDVTVPEVGENINI
ncbi:hypothetical protein OGAPHI_004330 [Ogataea philodendri]|uniref:CMP/dCMP-type deaminase domain-containing protein n=1 Tax=Ogataea philodendri TaxID=1378263 RepID=A0A9P8T5P1_9ASCO|nr:uncharacterized protein OGAPHI_004330 [Ogataea philodendri]KAH3666141.1 hypothetical protein OGAPHI_004330 [Ogataea philodendri]